MISISQCQQRTGCTAGDVVVLWEKYYNVQNVRFVGLDLMNMHVFVQVNQQKELGFMLLCAESFLFLLSISFAFTDRNQTGVVYIYALNLVYNQAS